MTRHYKFSAAIVIFFFLSCRNSRERITDLLNSTKTTDVVRDAYEAGESGDDYFVPLLLYKADDPRASTNLRFKGFSVYQEKMVALRKILKKEPPKKVDRYPDSAVIKFYILLAKDMQIINDSD